MDLSIFEDKFMRKVQESIDSIKDGHSKWRYDFVNFLNVINDTDKDAFFWDMIPAIRFLQNNSSSIAYTNRNKEIWMNAPGSAVGKDTGIWDFIFAHECLHQLWDTFGVGEKIQKAGITYNHYLLNVASDCVINDFLRDVYKKKPFADGIFPEYLKKQYNVDYDRRVDTQYTLYKKLIESPDVQRMMNDAKLQQAQDSEENGGGGSSSSGSPGSGSSGGSSSNGSSSQSSDPAQDASNSASDAQKNADKAQQAASGSGDAKAQKAADKAQKAAEKAKKAAEKAKKAADKGDIDKAQKAAAEAADAAEKAAQAAREAGVPENEISKSDSSKNSNNNGSGDGKDGDGKPGTEHKDSEVTENDFKDYVKETINKYRNKLSGPLGDFVKKSQTSAECEKGIVVKSAISKNYWNKDLDMALDSLIYQKVSSLKREWQTTYHRLKRGSGFVKWGEPIEPGRIVKNQQVSLKFVFYVDVSGSMDTKLDHVFKAVKNIAAAIDKKYDREKTISSTDFDLWVFDTDFEKLPSIKHKCGSRGGTCPFEDLTGHMIKNNGEAFCNIVITDGEFNVNTSKLLSDLKLLKGNILYVTNKDNFAVKDIAKKNKDKIKYILADPDFTVK